MKKSDTPNTVEELPEGFVIESRPEMVHFLSVLLGCESQGFSSIWYTDDGDEFLRAFGVREGSQVYEIEL